MNAANAEIGDWLGLDSPRQAPRPLAAHTFAILQSASRLCSGIVNPHESANEMVRRLIHRREPVIVVAAS